MKKKIREPVTLKYENNTLTLTWDYAITRTVIGNSEVYKVTVHDKFTKIAGLRQVVFICRTERPNHYVMTTVEPPEYVTYKAIKPNRSKNHANIGLPKNIVHVDYGQKIKLIYHPRETDIYGMGSPRIDIIIYTPEPVHETAVQTTTNHPTHLKWNIEQANIPEELQPLLSKEEKQEITELQQAEVTVKTDTLKITIEETAGE